MAFNTFSYILFLILALSAFYLVKNRFHPHVLLVASSIFYASWDWRFLGLIAFISVNDYAMARFISKNSGVRRKCFLLFSIVSNLGILGFYKYCNFFLDTYGRLTGSTAGDTLTLKIMLPLGISFITFRSMSYCVDVFRSKVCARKNLVEYAIYVLFFPLLIAGPIVRFSEFFAQYDNWSPPNQRRIQLAIGEILIGFILKAVVADQLSILCNPFFENPGSFPGALPAITAVMAFTVQIFADFAGYSHIAIGSSRLLGFNFSENFHRPYLSTDISDFWRRWHISLSTWLRDYVYISLGGNRNGQLKTYRNLMLTMLLGGLWHGASWNFVIWGGLHGFYLLFHRFYREHVLSKPGMNLRQNVLYHFGCWIVTLFSVGIAWIFFRSTHLNQSVYILRQILLPESLGDCILPIYALILILVMQLYTWCEEHYDIAAEIERQSWMVKGFMAAVGLSVLAVWGVNEHQISFIYFKF